MKNLKLKAARAGMDLSQADLAEAVGVSRQTISAIEKGDYNPTINLCINQFVHQDLQGSGKDSGRAFLDRGVRLTLQRPIRTLV